MAARPKLRRVYTAGPAAELLRIAPDVLRKRAQRGTRGALRPGSPENPLREWLFDADAVDAQAQATSDACLWVRMAEESPSALRQAEQTAVTSYGPDAEGQPLLDSYREHNEMLKTEVALEREHRLQTERRVVEVERDNALRELRRIQRAYRALVAELVDEEST